MIGRILEFSLRQRVLVLMAALAWLLGGIWSAFKLPMDAIPDITGVQVQVNTVATLDFALTVGDVKETLTVVAEPVSVPALREVFR